MLRPIVLPIALLASAAPGLAAPRDGDPPVSHVGYADLNLSTEAGRTTLERRVDGAVRQVCGQRDSHDLKGQSRVSRCRDEARARAQMQIAVATQQDRPAELASR